VDQSKVPDHIKEAIERFLPSAARIALYAGCNEMDFLMAADLLLDLTRGTVGEQPDLVAAHMRTREARLHLSQFNTFMIDLEEEKKKGPGIVVPGKGQIIT
jgi:hypothetical protein